MFKNTRTNYGSIAKFFHWSMAMLMVVIFVIGFTMINMSRSKVMFILYDLHKSTGLLLFVLVSFRLIWLRFNVKPQYPNVAIWQKWLAIGNVYALYLLMVIMPVSGVLTSTLSNHSITFYYLFSLPALGNNVAASQFFTLVHEYAAYTLLAVFGLHVVGAMYHHFVLKDDVLRRMLPSS